ncbi:MAG TPA: type II and III secretion system protein family protein [Beijerinckiaceae bacterium]|jgi:pilus assembly protein CpaC|nr:type II and III secretion system protein family protein [Beijerinckiaceae bacterium]
MTRQERSWRFGARAPRRFHNGALALAVAALILGSTMLLAAALSPAAAQTRLVEIGENKVGAVRIAQGKSQTLQTTLSFVDLVIGDPEIADVMPLTDRTMYVLGKKLGTTNVAVYDGSKALVGVIEIEVAYNTPRLAADVEERHPGERTRISSANGRTVLSGTMSDSVSAARAVALAKQYGPEILNDLKVQGSQQVMLEVRFVEASRNAGKELGVNWDVVGRNFGNPTRGALNFASALGVATLPSGTPPFGTILGRVLSSGVEADVMIRALEERGVVRRLAEPNLIAMSGEKASFLAGGEFPIPVAGTFQQITVEYKKFGVGLTFVPTVLANGVINLKIEPEVSHIDRTNSIRTGVVAIPAITVRRASTTIELRDGQSFAIAGLLQSVTADTQQQLPWLADVPILGALFRSAAFEKKETDLAIIVTPRLVKPAKPGQKLRTPLDDALPASDADRFLTGKQEIPIAKAARSGLVVPATGHILDLRREVSVVAKN